MINIATIGFAKKSLKEFLELLKQANVTCLIDTRLNNTSQLSGYAKKKDLQYILEEFMGIQYIHSRELAPTKEILNAFKSKKITWEEYKEKYFQLLIERNIKDNIEQLVYVDGTACFLCSEHKHHHCHRSILANYIKNVKNENINIIHL